MDNNYIKLDNMEQKLKKHIIKTKKPLKLFKGFLL
jgi:hypothetical protein